jgi:hypothetical protein
MGHFCAANVFKDLAARVYQILTQVTITATIWPHFEVLTKAFTGVPSGGGGYFFP